jgi:predicted O-methyltransferase YrrM
MKDPAVLSVLDEYRKRIDAEALIRKAVSRQEWLARRDEFLLDVGEAVGIFLNLTVRESGARTILEVGTSYGYSTLWLAEAARTTGGKVITLDRAAEKQTYSRTMVDRAGLSEFVTYRCGDALELIEQMSEAPDFVLIDLWKDVYIPCFDAVIRKASPGAIIVADNMIYPPDNREMAEAYRAHVRSHPGIESILLPLGHGIEVTSVQRKIESSTVRSE